MYKAKLQKTAQAGDSNDMLGDALALQLSWRKAMRACLKKNQNREVKPQAQKLNQKDKGRKCFWTEAICKTQQGSTVEDLFKNKCTLQTDLPCLCCILVWVPIASLFGTLSTAFVQDAGKNAFLGSE